MKKIIFVLSVFTSLILITNCSGSKSNQVVKAPDGMITLDLSKYGKQFSVFVPDTSVAKLEVTEQSWGALEVKVGKNFQISITEDPGDIELKKSDIKSNDVNVFKTYITEEPLTLFWESQITKPEYHFYTIQKLGENNYVIEDIMPSDGEPLSKDAVQRMLDSARQLVIKEKQEA